jgi:Domain of unknown function (DUF4301)
MLSQSDLHQIKSKEIPKEKLEEQIAFFKLGFPFINLVSPVTSKKGLHCFNDAEVAELAAWFDEHYSSYELTKFVPASGAASRMFKVLFEFMENYSGSPQDIELFEQDKSFNSPFNFFANITKFAFFEALKKKLKLTGYSIEELLSKQDYKTILEFLLTEEGISYAMLPKGLLLFHDYDDEPRLAIEEHLVEAAHYATDKENISRIHLTVSPEHQDKFIEAINQRKLKYEQKFDVNFEICFSQQKPSTDTIAVTSDNKPFRNDDGSLLFRPGGHGALIENLNDLGGEIIFIKNIDNVVPDRLMGDTFFYKKVIGGLLFKLQEKTFDFLEILDAGDLSDEELVEIRKFAEKELNIFIPVAYDAFDKMEQIDFLFNKMNRPMRVCGMVKNEGEPGGGPFWVIDENDNESLQIVEASQINFSDPVQKEIVNRSTHFNPVDLVCGVKNYKGDNFDLHEFVDPETGFISIKSKDGKELKALELPGLWNGAMADWITIFVETPLITFNPVKTINDLLRAQHQPE